MTQDETALYSHLRTLRAAMACIVLSILPIIISWVFRSAVLANPTTEMSRYEAAKFQK